jgi:hypothetical protein
MPTVTFAESTGSIADSYAVYGGVWGQDQIDVNQITAYDTTTDNFPFSVTVDPPGDDPNFMWILIRATINSIEEKNWNWIYLSTTGGNWDDFILPAPTNLVIEMTEGNIPILKFQWFGDIKSAPDSFNVYIGDDFLLNQVYSGQNIINITLPAISEPTSYNILAIYNDIKGNSSDDVVATPYSTLVSLDEENLNTWTDI